MRPGNDNTQSNMNIRDAVVRLTKQSDRKHVLTIINKRVRVNDHFEGKVVAVNETPYGAFPASHYPVIVELDVDFYGKAHQRHAFKLSDVQVIED